MKGVKEVESEWFNPYETILFNQAAKDTIDAIAAQIFLDLSEEKKIPSWVPSVIDIKMIRAAAGEYEQLSPDTQN
jgi:hypothetical protein